MEHRRALELFSGTGSVGKWCRANGFDEVVSLDILPSANATHTCDVMQWDYTMYPQGHFEVVWSSPPCTHYSCARTTGPPRDLDGANAIVKRTLQIIEYFKPQYFFIENPGTGMLVKMDFMKEYPRVMADYCRYSGEDDQFLYRKRTCFFTNREELLADPPLLCHGQCDGIRTPVPGRPEGKKTHAQSFGGQRGGKRFYLVSNIGLHLKHRIPQRLLTKLFIG